MNYAVLRVELANDPEERGYVIMTDAEAATDLNMAYQTRNKATMTASEVAQSINVAEFTGKTEAQQRLIWDVLHMGTINPFGVEQALFVSVFGAGSDTIAALAAARVDAITRAQALGLGTVTPGAVGRARVL